MADTKLDIKIPQQSIMYIGIGIVVILLFIFLGIVPANRSLAELDKQAADVKYLIEEQKTLAPFYQTIKNRGETKASEVLPLPEKGKLALSKIDTIPMIVGTSARTSGMSLISATPDMKALSSNTQFLPVNVVLQGDFFNFRKFLISLGGIPYIQNIEEISIQQIPDAREFKLKILVAVG